MEQRARTLVTPEGPVPTISQSMERYLPSVLDLVACRIRARSVVVEVSSVRPLERVRDEGRSVGRGRPFLLLGVEEVEEEEEEDWPGRVRPALGIAGGRVERRGMCEEEEEVPRRPRLYASARDSEEMPCSSAQRWREGRVLFGEEEVVGLDWTLPPIFSSVGFWLLV